MNNTEIKNNLINFYSYDTSGCDFGIKDDELKSKTLSALEDMGEDNSRKLISELLIECFLDEESLAEGYSWEDAKSFLNWYADGMF